MTRGSARGGARWRERRLARWRDVLDAWRGDHDLGRRRTANLGLARGHGAASAKARRRARIWRGPRRARPRGLHLRGLWHRVLSVHTLVLRREDSEYLLVCALRHLFDRVFVRHLGRPTSLARRDTIGTRCNVGQLAEAAAFRVWTRAFAWLADTGCRLLAYAWGRAR